MYGLILDTATPTSFLILTSQGKIIDLFTFSDSSKISTPLLKTLACWQEKYRLSSENMAYLAMGKGPGSFTGSKVGIILAKTFSYAHQVPLLSFCSLISLTPETTGSFSLLLDAKSSGLFILEGKRTKETVQFFLPFKTILLEKIPLALEKTSRWVSHKKEDLESKILFSPFHWEKREPNYPFLAEYLYERYQRKEDFFSFFSPLYTPLSCEKEPD